MAHGVGHGAVPVSYGMALPRRSWQRYRMGMAHGVCVGHGVGHGVTSWAWGMAYGVTAWGGV